jgi:hypothetical protein
MCAPTGHDGVSGAPDDDGRQTDDEGASDAGDWDAGSSSTISEQGLVQKFSFNLHSAFS